MIGLFQVTLRKNSSEGTPPFMRRDSGDEQAPAFVREFALRRRSSGGNSGSGFNPNEPAPPRPQSAVIVPQGGHRHL